MPYQQGQLLWLQITVCCPKYPETIYWKIWMIFGIGYTVRNLLKQSKMLATVLLFQTLTGSSLLGKALVSLPW